MNLQKIAQDNKILEIQTGSILYGTNLPTSDIDYSGVFIAPKEFYLGFDSVNEVDLSVISKNSDGKNNQDAIDKKLYEFRKFITLAKDNNPNIIEQIFVNKQNIVFINEIGEELLKIAEVFPHKGLAQKFIGYSRSQLHKMKVKPDNLKALVDAKEHFERLFTNGFKVSTPLHLLNGSGTPNYIRFYDDFCNIGDLNFNLQVKIGDVYTSICTRIDKASHRADGFLKYGYDCKFGMHAIRLCLEGIELLKTGAVQFPLKDKDFLLDIRNGKHSADEVINYVEELTKELDDVVLNSKLPDKPRVKIIEAFMIEILETKFNWRS